MKVAKILNCSDKSHYKALISDFLTLCKKLHKIRTLLKNLIDTLMCLMFKLIKKEHPLVINWINNTSMPDNVILMILEMKKNIMINGADNWYFVHLSLRVFTCKIIKAQNCKNTFLSEFRNAKTVQKTQLYANQMKK